MKTLLDLEFKLKHFLLVAIMLAAFVAGVTVVTYEVVMVDIIVTGSGSDRTEVRINLAGDRSLVADDINNSTLFVQVLAWELQEMSLEVEGGSEGWVDVTVQGFNQDSDFSYSMLEVYTATPIFLPFSQKDVNSSFRLEWGGVPADMARILVVGEFEDAELVSPSGDKISLHQDGPIYVPANEAERYVVHVMGDKEWMNIAVTSFDGKARWAFALEDAGGTIYQAGNSAITSYYWK